MSALTANQAIAHSNALCAGYGVPGLEAEAFERACRKLLPHLFKRQTDLLFHIVTMVTASAIRYEC